MGWQQDGAHGTAHRSPDRSLASNWPSRQIGGSIRGYPAGPSARWPARRVQSAIIAQSDTLDGYALPTTSRTRASAAGSGVNTPGIAVPASLLTRFWWWLAGSEGRGSLEEADERVRGRGGDRAPGRRGLRRRSRCHQQNAL